MSEHEVQGFLTFTDLPRGVCNLPPGPRGPVGPAAAPAYTYAATIVRWLDGDTAELTIDLGFTVSIRVLVRVLALDTPERGRAGHDEALAAAEALAPAGTPVVITTKRRPVRADSFVRYLASITLADGRDVGAAMRQQGWADYTPGTHHR